MGLTLRHDAIPEQLGVQVLARSARPGFLQIFINYRLFCGLETYSMLLGTLESLYCVETNEYVQQYTFFTSGALATHIASFGQLRQV